MKVMTIALVLAVLGFFLTLIAVIIPGDQFWVLSVPGVSCSITGVFLSHIANRNLRR